jgi:hypothetical protein
MIGAVPLYPIYDFMTWTRKMLPFLQDSMFFSNNNNNNSNKYIKRHDRVSAQLHFNIRKKIGVQLDKNTGTNMYQNQ